MTGPERVAVRGVLLGLGVSHCWRATSDPTEEVILLTPDDYARVDVPALTEDLMGELPHRKVWVAPMSALWQSERI